MRTLTVSRSLKRSKATLTTLRELRSHFAITIGNMNGTFAERSARTMPQFGGAFGHCCWHVARHDRSCPKRSKQPYFPVVLLERAKGFEPSTPTLARLVQNCFRWLPQIDVR